MPRAAGLSVDVAIRQGGSWVVTPNAGPCLRKAFVFAGRPLAEPLAGVGAGTVWGWRNVSRVCTDGVRVNGGCRGRPEVIAHIHQFEQHLSGKALPVFFRILGCR